MINTDTIIHTSGLVLMILISASVISYTSRFIFGSEKGTHKKLTNQIYDPDHGRNMSYICVTSKDAYATAYENSACYNMTHMQWYNPWLRHDIWKRFWIEVDNKKKEIVKEEMVLNVTEVQSVNETAPEELPEREKPEEPTNIPREQTKEKPIEFVYSILVGMLMISVLVACWEVFKDKLGKNEAAAAKVQERECTLADFTINRHLRRESQQQAASHLPRQGSLELTAKVTQTLIHQSSLDRAFPKLISEAMNPVEVRRNSMPFYLGGEAQPGPSSTTTRRPSKRYSVDVSGEDGSGDFKKKTRYFIRRH